MNTGGQDQSLVLRNYETIGKSLLTTLSSVVSIIAALFSASCNIPGGSTSSNVNLIY
jgi:hypothetical protein